MDDCIEDEEVMHRSPKTLDELKGWIHCCSIADEIIGDIGRWFVMLKSDLGRRFTDEVYVEWIQDAIIAAEDNAKPEKGGPRPYVTNCLKKWTREGGREKVELAQAAAEAKAKEDAPTVARAEEEKALARTKQQEAEKEDAAWLARWDRMGDTQRGRVEARVREDFPEMAALFNRQKVMLKTYCISYLRSGNAVAPFND